MQLFNSQLNRFITVIRQQIINTRFLRTKEGIMIMKHSQCLQANVDTRLSRVNRRDKIVQQCISKVW